MHYLFFIISFFCFFGGLGNHYNHNIEDDGDKLISFSIIFFILGGIEIEYNIIPMLFKTIFYVISLY